MGKSRNRNRANGEGWKNLRPDGRYNVGLHVSLPDGTLKRKETTIRGSDKADRWLTREKSLRDRGLVLSDENPTLSAYLAAWLEDSVKGTVAHATYAHHKRIVNNHITPVLGAIKMRSLTPRHVQRLNAIKREEGLALSTRRHVHTTLKKALSQAHAWGDVPTNPAAGVRPPKGRGDSEERGQDKFPLSQSQLEALLHAAEGTRLGALVRFAAATGLREQELFALRWSEVELSDSFAGGLVYVRHALIQAEKGHEIGPVKTPKSRRNVEFSEGVAAVLRKHRSKQAEQRLSAERWADTNLVFPTTVGTPMTRHLIHKPFKAVLRRAGLPERHSFGDLRHTFATLMFARNVHPKIVSEMLGHSSIAVTLDIYSQWLPGLHRGVSSVLDDVFG